MLARTLTVLAASLLSVGRATAQNHDHGTSTPSAGKSSPELARQLEVLRLAVDRYRDIEVAKAEGFVRFGKDEGPLMGEHWYRKGGADAPFADSIDLARPGTLMYARIGGQPVLVGVAYSVRLRPGEPHPEGFVGGDDRWHVHDLEKIVRASTEERPVLRWMANRELEKRRRIGDDRSRLTMVHAWVPLENPDGPFAEQHRLLPYLKLGLPSAWATGADVAAARGLHLATEDGCGTTLRGQLWVAKASRDQRRTIEGECERLATRVRGAVARHGDAAALNDEARDAWLVLDSVKRRTLSAQQRARIDAVTDHPMGAP